MFDYYYYFNSTTKYNPNYSTKHVFTFLNHNYIVLQTKSKNGNVGLCYTVFKFELFNQSFNNIILFLP